jgi:hypothetical protein
MAGPEFGKHSGMVDGWRSTASPEQYVTKTSSMLRDFW